MEKQKILIADDSEMNRALLVDILEDQYDIVEADNGAVAIDLLTQCGGDFSLLDVYKRQVEFLISTKSPMCTFSHTRLSGRICANGPMAAPLSMTLS